MRLKHEIKIIKIIYKILWIIEEEIWKKVKLKKKNKYVILLGRLLVLIRMTIIIIIFRMTNNNKIHN